MLPAGSDGAGGAGGAKALREYVVMHLVRPIPEGVLPVVRLQPDEAFM
jgi:hypothetical protein